VPAKNFRNRKELVTERNWKKIVPNEQKPQSNKDKGAGLVYTGLSFFSGSRWKGWVKSLPVQNAVGGTVIQGALRTGNKQSGGRSKQVDFRWCGRKYTGRTNKKNPAFLYGKAGLLRPISKSGYRLKILNTELLSEKIVIV
jgi:hypothetical protein